MNSPSKQPHGAPQTMGLGGDLDSWRPEQGLNGRRRRFTIRLTLTLLVLGATTWLAYDLVQPFFNPDVHLVILQPASANALALTGEDGPLYAANDLDDFERLGNDLHRYDEDHPPVRLAGLQTPDDFRSLKSQLDKLAPGTSNTLTLFLTARGFTDNGEAWLCWPSPGGSDAEDRLRLDDLLQQLAGHWAQVKLLVIDVRSASGTGSAALTRPVIDEFPRLLQRAVERTGDRSLWVLASHSILERSALDHARRRSIFAECVARGLRGGADGNEDDSITVGELYGYVSAGVAARVQRSSGMRTTQTPLLFWGGGSPDLARSPRLIPALGNASDDEDPPRGPLFPRTLSVAALRDSGGLPPEDGPLPEFPPPLPAVLDLTAAAPHAAGASEFAVETPSKTEAKSKPAAKSGGKPNGGKAPARKLGPAEKLVLARLWRDAVLRRSAEGGSHAARFSAVDDAPHLLRELDHRLLVAERVYRSRGPFDSSAQEGDRAELRDRLSTRLDELIRLYRALQTGRIAPNPTASLLEKRVAKCLADWKSAAGDPQDPAALSLGLAERISARTRMDSRGKLFSAAASAAGELDRLIDDGSQAAFRKWATQLDARLLRYSELEFAHRLAAQSPADWRDVRFALAVRRYGERVAAAAAGAIDWVHPLIARADRERLIGERRLIDGIGGDYEGRAQRRLQAAARDYFEAAQRLHRVRAAVMLRNDLLYELPSCVAWQRRAEELDTFRKGVAEDLQSLIELTGALAWELERPDAQRFDRLAQIATHAVVQRSRLRALIAQEVVQPAQSVLAGTEAVPGDLQRFEAALELSTLTAGERVAVLRAIERIAVAERTQNPPRLPARASPESRIVGPADTARLLRRVERLVACSRLLRSAPANEKTTVPQEAELRQDGKAWKRLQAARNRFGGVLASGQPGGDLWTANREFQTALMDFHRQASAAVRAAASPRVAARGLPPANLADWQSRRDMLVRAERIARLLPGSVSGTGGELALEPLMARFERQAMIVWQRERLLAAMQDAPQGELASLRGAERGCRAALFDDDGAPPLPPFSLPSITVRAPATVSLRDDSTSQIAIEVRAQSPRDAARTVDGEMPPAVPMQSPPAALWIWLEFDPAVLDVRSKNGVSLSPLRPSSSGDGGFPRETTGAVVDLGESSSAAKPTGLSPSALHLLQLQIARRIASRLRPARVVVHASRGGETVRGTVVVPLPQPETVALTAESPAGISRIASTARDGLELYPFPNRQTQFRLSLQNLTGGSRTVDVTLLAVSKIDRSPLPRAEITQDESQRLLQRRGAARVLAEQTGVALPANDDPVPLTLKAPAPPAGKSPAAKGNVPAAKPISRKPATAVINDGLLVAVRDTTTNQVSLRRILFAPQRPRRFLNPEVGYDARRRTLTVRIRPRDRTWLPAGEINVTAEVVPRDAPSSDGRTIALTGKLPPAADSEVAPELVLSGDLPPSRAATANVFVHVDEFPRAFVYRVPLRRSSATVPEDSSRRALRIIGPRPGTVLGASAKSIAVALQVDAPVGSFQNASDSVEIGIDANRDRTLEHEPVLRFASDRQVRVTLEGLGEDGSLQIAAAVGDFRVELPIAGDENRRVNILGRQSTGVEGTAGSMFWSEPVEIVLDALPPVVSPVAITRVVEGETARLVVQADDADLSGVAKVELLVDEKNSGTFSPGAAPIGATASAAGGWTAEVPTDGRKPGVYPLLVRATDRAGNVSDVVTSKLVVLSKQQAMANRANRVAGTVTFDQQPIAGAVATLTPVARGKAPAIPPSRTDEGGRFLFSNVPPGKYKLTVFKDALAGRRRVAEAALDVPAAPQPVPIQRLKLN